MGSEAECKVEDTKDLLARAEKEIAHLQNKVKERELENASLRCAAEFHREALRRLFGI